MTLPSDRPVIAEPEERPYKALPALGQMRDAFRLTGTRQCPCGVDFIITPGKGAENRRYCSETCRRRHAPPAGAERPCAACGAGITGQRRYCDPCAANVCYLCQRKGGAHTPRCPTQVPPTCLQCKATLTPEDRYRRSRLCAACRPCVVTEDEVLDLYLQTRRAALRAARRIVGSEAEDVVQTAALGLLTHRDTLKFLSPRLFVFNVRRLAVAYRRSPWSRHVIALDPEGLLVVEKKLEDMRRGRPRAEVITDVRLPGEVAG